MCEQYSCYKVPQKTWFYSVAEVLIIHQLRSDKMQRGSLMFSGGLVGLSLAKQNQISCDDEIKTKSCSIDDWRIDVIDAD